MAQKKENFSPTNNIHYLLRLYALNYNSYEIPMKEFISFINRYLEQDKQNEIIRGYTKNTEQRLIDDIELLSYENRCKLEYINGEIRNIYFPRFFVDKIHKAYKGFEDDIDKNFPTEDSIGLAIPQPMVTVVNIKNDFVRILSDEEQDAPQIIRILFPDMINPVLITSDLASTRLLDFAVYKIKFYMEKKRNSSYIENKIYPVFRQQTRSLKEIIKNIVVKPTQVIASIKAPSDFSFRFWAHFANLIIQEYKQKNELLPQEHGFCQAAYLIGFYNVYFKSRWQKEKEREMALRQFEKLITRQPYAFTLTDIYAFKDSNGFLLLKKYSKDYIHKILEDKTQSTDPNVLPDIIRFLTSSGSDYYIHKSSILTLCFKKVESASQELKKFYITQWVELLRQNKKSDIMQNDAKFLNDLTEKVHLSYPVLASLLGNHNLLFLLHKEFPVSDRRRLATLLNRTNNILQPLNVILELDRRDILEEARNYLPFWETVPVLKWFVRLLKRIFVGKKRAAANDTEKIQKRVSAKYSAFGTGASINPGKNAPTATNKSLGIDGQKTMVPKLRANYKKAIVNLRQHFVGDNDTTSSKLSFLADKWNPLFDAHAKKNLEEDVNSMIRDYIRSLKRGFRVKPPDIHRIESLAVTLTKNKHFNEIKKKDYLRTYIEVYMVKLLEDNKF